MPEPVDITEQPPAILPQEFEWKCLTCEKTAPPTESGNYALRPHKCTGERKIRLIDKKTGDIVATTLSDAQEKGFVEKGKKEETEKEKTEKEKTVGEVGKGPIVSEAGQVKLTVTLPAAALFRFELLKAEGIELEPPDKDFDVWLWDCIVARFKKDYKQEVTLAPIREETIPTVGG